MRVAIGLIVAAMLVLVSASVSAHEYSYDSHRYYDWDRYDHNRYWHDDVRTVHVYRHHQPIIVHDYYRHPHQYALYAYQGYRYW